MGCIPGAFNDPGSRAASISLFCNMSGEIVYIAAPDQLLIVDELPLTALLKPDRLALRELITLHDADIQRRRPTGQ